MAKKTFDYFLKFEESALAAQESAALINNVLNNFNEKDLYPQLEKIHDLENRADSVKHDVHMSLSRDFLPPIEIEDIAELAECLDDISDYLEDILLTLYSFNITSIRPQALEFSSLILKSIEAVVMVVKELRNYKKSSKLKPATIQINQYENEGDKLFVNAVRDLYTNESDPITIIKWTRVYDYLEKCCDAMEDVADVVDGIILKNS